MESIIQINGSSVTQSKDLGYIITLHTIIIEQKFVCLYEGDDYLIFKKDLETIVFVF